MANHITKAEREELIATCRGHLENGTPAETIIQALANADNVSRDRARSAVAKAQRRMRGEEVQKHDPVRRGVSLDMDSLEHITAIEAATGINGASAVIRQALRRWAAEL